MDEDKPQVGRGSALLLPRGFRHREVKAVLNVGSPLDNTGPVLRHV